MRPFLRWFVVVACFAGMFGESLASAGNPLARPAKREAREHLDRGNKLYNLRSFDDAIAEFKAGAIIEPVPVFDYNLGQAYRQLGKCQDALWHYDRFLKYGHLSGELLSAVTGFMAEMRAQLTNRALTMPPTTPADGSPSPNVSRSAAEPDRERHDGSTSPIDQNRPRDWFALSFAGVGVGAVGVAGYLFADASHLHTEANASPQSQARRNKLHDQASTRRALGTVIGFGGVSLLVAAAVEYAIHSRHRASPAVAAWNVGVTSNSVVIFGGF
jgi:tetratricopeptide (TPR) repeat protein